MPASYAQSAHTLPRNFTFHYSDGELPRTPEPLDREERDQVPPPPLPAREYGQPYRLRRRRPQIVSAQSSYRAIPATDATIESRDVALPSIEVFHAPTGFNHLDLAATSLTSTGLRSAATFDARPFPPPRTPAAQTYGPNEHRDRVDVEFGAEDSSSQGDSLTRPSTACSGFSNSSKSSSIESFPSLPGSCTSPEIESGPFDLPSLQLLPNAISTPALSPPPPHNYASSTTRSTSMLQTPRWTDDMDHHLWITYMRYLQDSTHTPFKMLPGSSPPLGVCARVVREAKRTWRDSRTAVLPRACTFARWGSHRAATTQLRDRDADEPGIHDELKSRKSHIVWPRSEGATRKRLRYLCKQKPTLSAHHHRLLHIRSPSPFQPAAHARSTSLARELSSPYTRSEDSEAFSTRDMNISLSTSTSITMQLGNPLTQLSSDMTTPRARPETWSNLSSGRSPGHQKSQSLHLGFNSQQAAHRGLASPFRPTNAFTSSRTDIASSGHSDVLGSISHLLAPSVELHAPAPRRSLFKRPAHQDCGEEMNSEDPFTRQNHLMMELFGPSMAVEPAHRRVRSRGFSLGDMSSGTCLSHLFSSPISSESMNSVSQAVTTEPSQNLLRAPPSNTGAIRLGSPFAEKSGKKHFNTFPRNFSLPKLEPAMETTEESAIFSTSGFSNPFAGPGP